MLGKHSPTLRRLRALRRDGERRRAERVFVAEGIHLAGEAVAAPERIELVVTSPRLAEADEGRALVARMRAIGIEPLETTDATLAVAQDARSPQPVVTLLRFPAEDSGPELGDASSVLVLDDVGDPGNLGSLVRSADAAGFDACFVVGASVDPTHPRAVRATMGSVLRLWPERTERAPLFDRLRRAGLRRVGADPRAARTYDVDGALAGRVALVLGGEAGGISRATRAELDDAVRIPMRDGVESLSVAAAGAVLLFEIARQRRR